jgi:hypothetical protein
MIKKNLLIIGNGFDLVHGLKTTYSDFLAWAYMNNRMSQYNRFSLRYYWENRSKDADGRAFIDSGIYYMPKFVDRLFAEYDNWIDLENNLATIISEWDASLTPDRERNIKTLQAILDEFLLPEFEHYIANYVNETNVAPLFKTKMKNVNCVLSFNYSNTFERLYQQEAGVEICYINGKAEKDSNQSHIVFGYDYTGDQQGNEWLKYDKVFQRAYKSKNKQYKKWMKGNDAFSIHIIGHSLGKTDHAILSEFIKDEKNQTIVYYHTDDSHQQLIGRMMSMIGKELFDKRDIDFRHIDDFSVENYKRKPLI